MKIAIKYCGGCNNYYDRPAVAAGIAARFPEFTLDYDDPQDADYVVVLCGCTCQCVRHEHLTGRLGKSIVFSPDQVPQLMEVLAALPR